MRRDGDCGWMDGWMEWMKSENETESKVGSK